MKRPAILFVLGAFSSASMAFAESAPPFEVHEWGTFTVVCGSDGQPIRWYQPRKTLAELPAFVIPQGLSINSTLPSENQLTKSGSGTLTLSPAATGDAQDATELPAFVLPQDQVRPASVRGIVVAGKTGTATYSTSHGFFVRMETPVIYFYPEKAMHVSVDVTMKQGHITEWFPQHAGAGANGGMHWDGELESPADPAAARLLPVDLAHGARYARARSVPNAWFFHTAAGAAATPVAVAKARSPAPEAWEKFIFYRGAGDELPPYRVEAPAASVVRLSHFGEGAGIPGSFLLEIGSRGARWARINSLPEMTGNQGAPFVEGDLNMPVNPLPAVQEGLAAAMRAALVEAGLTTDEARAMVATWGDVWFSETGTRVLAILPRAWVDSTLPLTVNPAPSKLTRVFVARFEVFTQEREQALLSLLTAEDKPGAEALEKFLSLRLDRFATAALERARRLADERMRAVFTALQAAEKKPAGQ